MRAIPLLIAALLLQGCIAIPVAAMLVAKIAYESHKTAHCEKAEGRCE